MQQDRTPCGGNEKGTVSRAEIDRQMAFLERILSHNEEFFRAFGRRRTAFAHTFGCQQNAYDGDRIAGMLEAAGFVLCDDAKAADLVVFNTCAIRENAEDRVYGNTGALLASKRANPDKIICLCGCMVQHEASAAKVRQRYPYVDMMVGVHALHRFPELLLRRMENGGGVYEIPASDGVIAEGLPIRREDRIFAGLPVSYGCDNFCSYCVVPYVRGRERSRCERDIFAEFSRLVADGYREITLLGQNVNSYGGDFNDGAAGGSRFAGLLSRLCEIEGDYRVRFMTSHPKDASQELFEAMAASSRVARHLHLPVQSGSDSVLARMNRRYSAADYLKKIEAARALMPGLSVTSDILVGFPGETEQDFCDTLALVEEVGFDALFMFIYSRRAGTPADGYADQVPAEVQSERFERLLRLQERISERMHGEAVGRCERVLLERYEEKHAAFSGKNDGAMRVIIPADSGDYAAGDFVRARIVAGGRHSVRGEVV